MLYYRPLFWSADCLVFVCEAQRRHWRRRLVVGRANEVIHNGVDPRALARRPAEVRSAHAPRARPRARRLRGRHVRGVAAGEEPPATGRGDRACCARGASRRARCWSATGRCARRSRRARARSASRRRADRRLPAGRAPAPRRRRRGRAVQHLGGDLLARRARGDGARPAGGAAPPSAAPPRWCARGTNGFLFPVGDTAARWSRSLAALADARRRATHGRSGARNGGGALLRARHGRSIREAPQELVIDKEAT